MLDSQSELLSVAEAARLVRVSPDSIRRWILTGKLRAFRLGEHGHWRVLARDLAAYVNQPRRSDG